MGRQFAFIGLGGCHSPQSTGERQVTDTLPTDLER